MDCLEIGKWVSPRARSPIHRLSGTHLKIIISIFWKSDSGRVPYTERIRRAAKHKILIGNFVLLVELGVWMGSMFLHTNKRQKLYHKIGSGRRLLMLLQNLSSLAWLREIFLDFGSRQAAITSLPTYYLPSLASTRLLTNPLPTNLVNCLLNGCCTISKRTDKVWLESSIAIMMMYNLYAAPIATT